MRRILSVITLTLLLAAPGCGGDDEKRDGGALETYQAPEIEDPGPIHVHGLGVNPADDVLFIATHTGLFRSAPGESTSERVGDSYQDTMGFTVIGPDRFLGSGHPGGGDDDRPPFLGLINSADAGENWDEVSLMGEADFHVLEASGDRVYGFGSDWESREPVFLVSDNLGESWEAKQPPEPLLSLAIAPDDPDLIVVAGERALYRSRDGGDRWQTLDDGVGLLSWASSGELYRVDGRGGVSESSDEGESWRPRGRIDGQPAAFEVDGNDLYAALHDGTIKLSTDGGRTWTVRSQPKPVVYG